MTQQESPLFPLKLSKIYLLVKDFSRCSDNQLLCSVSSHLPFLSNTDHHLSNAVVLHSIFSVDFGQYYIKLQVHTKSDHVTRCKPSVAGITPTWPTCAFAFDHQLAQLVLSSFPPEPIHLFCDLQQFSLLKWISSLRLITVLWTACCILHSLKFWKLWVLIWCL